MAHLKSWTVAALMAIGGPAAAQSDAQTDALYAALAIPELLEIMRAEGLEYGADIGRDLFAGRAADDWSAIVSDIYDLDRMEAGVSAAFAVAMQDADVAAMLEFFQGPVGENVIKLEVSARRALLDDAVEEAAKLLALQAAEDETARYRQVEQFIAVNDLVETNVVGALNSNFAFYMGLYEGGAVPAELSEDQVLRDVWSQEPQIRENTSEWVRSFLHLAYQPLSDAEMEAYLAFSQTAAGEALNRAMFTSFDEMFEGISRALGLNAARYMTGQDI